MKKLYYLAIALAVIFVILTVYFMIPGIYHPYISFHDGKPGLVNAAKHWGTVSSVHHIYAAGVFVGALAFGLIAFLTRPKKQVVKVA